MSQPQLPPSSGTVTRSVLSSGVRVLTERIPHVRTVAVGIWVSVGSRYEPVEHHGISHFLEHLFFKGTATRSALEIAQAVDDVRGRVQPPPPPARAEVCSRLRFLPPARR